MHAKIAIMLTWAISVTCMLGAGTCMLASGNMHVETQHLFLMHRHEGAGGSTATISPLFFNAYPQTRIPAPSVPGPYAGAAGAGPNPLSIALNPRPSARDYITTAGLSTTGPESSRVFHDQYVIDISRYQLPQP